MTKQTKALILLSWISGMSFLSGCATSMGRAPEHSPTMLQVYNAAMHDSSGNSINALRRRVVSTDAKAYAYSDSGTDQRTDQGTNQRTNQGTDQGTREKTRYKTYAVSDLQALDQQFPRLPDPDIELYVYPHLAEQSEVPVRGYQTAFTLYTKDYFALPGELASPLQTRRG